MGTVPRKRTKRHGVCRLTLTIGHDLYAIRRKDRVELDSAWIKDYRLRKLTGERNGTTYEVGKHKGTGWLACTCVDFLRHNAPGKIHECKHVRAMVAVGLLSSRRPRPSERKAVAHA